MALLGERGVLSLLVEGGGVLHASFFAAGLVDKVHAIIAPKIVGGDAVSRRRRRRRRAHGATRSRCATSRSCALGDDVAFVGYPQTR